MKSRVDKFLDKLNKSLCDNDKEFLDCLIDLDNQLKKIRIENKRLIQRIIDLENSLYEQQERNVMSLDIPF